MEDASQTPPPAAPTAAAATAAPPWVGFVTWTALAIVALSALQVIGMIAQGASTKLAALGTADKIGYTFVQTLDRGPIGFEIVVAVLLVLTPVIARRASTPRLDRLAQVVLTAGAAVAFIVVIGGVVAVPAQLHFTNHVQRQPTTAALRWALVTFELRNVGLALLALAASVAAVRVRFQPRRIAPDDTPAP